MSTTGTCRVSDGIWLPPKSLLAAADATDAVRCGAPTQATERETDHGKAEGQQSGGESLDGAVHDLSPQGVPAITVTTTMTAYDGAGLGRTSETTAQVSPAFYP